VDLRLPSREPPQEPQAGSASLPAGEVHLWWGRVDADEGLDTVLAVLSDEERRRSERFRREGDARAFLFRRAFLRRVLAFHTGAEPAELRFARGEFGKPALESPACAGIAFNASSSGEWALVAVAEGRVLGVDVERADERLADPEELSRLARRVLTEAERAALLALLPERRLAGFLRLWTRKEAVLKLLGTGLSREPDTLEVGLEPAEEARTLEVAGQAELVTLDLAAPAGYCASAVAAAEPGERLVFRPRDARDRAR
jgi:4'-phosphopantetheinyl transferase